MKQTFCKRIGKMLSCIAVMSIVLAMGMLASCSESDNPTQGGAASEVADLVVYGKIFTSENNQIVEAFAVKDGKYIYVGDKKGAEAYIEAGKTRLVDYRGKGLVMPGCGNGHSHYMLGYALKTIGRHSRQDHITRWRDCGRCQRYAYWSDEGTGTDLLALLPG